MSISNAIVGIIDAILPYINAGVILVAFVAIVMTGFELITNRKDEDKRKEVLMSLIFVALGIMIVVGSLFITRLLLTSAVNVKDIIQGGN